MNIFNFKLDKALFLCLNWPAALILLWRFAKSTMASPQSATEAAETCGEKCYICLGPFEEQAVGALETCAHEFCLECIVQWSQTANTCPVDRSTFTIIHQRRRLGGVVHKKITVAPPRTRLEEEASPAVICEDCGRSDRRSRMLLCSHCDSGFHMNCLRPAVSERPEGSWVCPDCELALTQPDGFAGEEGISDGELEDILSEADETSSRLRPSTRGVSGAEPRIDRVQTRSSRGPVAPPPITRVPKYLLKASSSEATTAENTPGASSDASDETEQKKRRRT